MVKKTIGFNKTAIGGLPGDKPVVYQILTETGSVNYAGSAQRGRVRERLQEHLAGQRDAIPGAKVQIEQMRTISEARKKEAAVISREQPKYNKQGK